VNGAAAPNSRVPRGGKINVLEIKKNHLLNQFQNIEKDRGKYDK
jgi:hypothetical protein